MKDDFEEDKNDHEYISLDILLGIFVSLPATVREEGVPDWILQLCVYKLSKSTKYSFLNDYWTFSNFSGFPFSVSLYRDLCDTVSDDIVEIINSWGYTPKKIVVKKYDQECGEIFSPELITSFKEIGVFIESEINNLKEYWGLRNENK